MTKSSKSFSKILRADENKIVRDNNGRADETVKNSAKSKYLKKLSKVKKLAKIRRLK